VELLMGALPLAGNLLLAWHFGATLRPGQEPLITRYTRAELGLLPPELAGYTRRLTWLWTLFFLAFAMANLFTLAGAGPAPGPSAVANLALSALFFLGEHPVRRALFPGLGPATPISTLRAMWRDPTVNIDPYYNSHRASQACSDCVRGGHLVLWLPASQW
jgi:hypothetical protein